MLRCEKAGYTVVLHVHDEIVAEISNRSSLGLEEFYELMTELPEWAKDCPVTANGWKGNRYRK